LLAVVQKILGFGTRRDLRVVGNECLRREHQGRSGKFVYWLVHTLESIDVVPVSNERRSSIALPPLFEINGIPLR
jgi:hypothetical protein